MRKLDHIIFFSLSFIPLVIGCSFENTTDFNGNDLEPACGLTNVLSAAECCNHCEDTPKCSFYTYMPSKKTCCLKTSDAGRRTPFKDYISGGVTPSPCQDDMGCSLNGVCDKATGKCKCDTPWTHSDCSRLDFGQAKFTNCGPGCAYHGYDGNKTTSWGGSVLCGDDEKYYMMVAEMANGCTLGQWTTNSQVAAAVANTPYGPYTKYATTIKPWAHNPEWIQSNDGTYLIFTLGDGVPHGTIKNCTHNDKYMVKDGYNKFSSNPILIQNGTVNFTIHYSTSLQGPWQAHVASIPNFPPADNMHNWNPSPVLMADGRIRVMVHTDPAPWAGEIIVEAKDWRGPYIPLTSDIPSFTIPKTNEDPFMWKDHRNNWHVLVHRMFDPPGQGPVPSPGWCGGHAFSIDGLSWSAITRCYNTTVVMEDGTSWETLRRERPKLLFNQKGQPTHLFNGVITKNSGTYTMVMPLKN